MIVITGATGFIGSNLVADLNARGRTDLILVDDLGTEGKWKNIAKQRFLDIVHPSQVDKLLSKLGGAEVVFHMGANSSTTAVDGDEILRTNFHSSVQWWKWCTSSGTPLIYASSAATYGNGSQGFQDSDGPDYLDRLRPLNLYGWSKHAFDKWATERAESGDAPPYWAGIKFFNVYGPNEYHKGEMKSLVAKNTELVSTSRVVRLFKSYRNDYPDGGQLRDFVYVKDCTEVMLWLSQKKPKSGIFNLGTGKPRAFVELINAIGKALEKEVSIEFVEMPEAIRPNYQYFTAADMTKLHTAGYPGSIRSIEEGVYDYVSSHLATSDPYR